MDHLLVTVPTDPGSILNYTTAGAMVALALWILWLESSSLVHRTLALFLGLRGLLNAMAPLSEVTDPPQALLTVDHIVDAGVLLAALAFVVAYRDPRLARASSRRSVWALGAAFAVAAVAYTLDPGLWSASGEAGPLYALRGLRYFAYAVVAWVLAIDATRTSGSARRSGLLLVSVGFGLNSLYQGLVHLFLYDLADLTGPLPDFAQLAGGPYVAADHFLRVAALVPLFALTVHLVRCAGSDGSELQRREVRPYNALMLVTAASAALHVNAVAFDVMAARTSATLGVVIDSVWALANPLILTVALLRHGLFDVQVKVKSTIRQSTVAGIFIMVFFIVSEGAQEVFAGQWGPFLGIIAAGTLLFALAPLQHFASRVADRAMPDVRPVAEMGLAERSAIYLEQAKAAWADGAVDRSERAMLDRLRETLKLPADTAMALETEASEQ